ncbi:type IV secretion protein Rhs [Planctomonas sp. JC2975]|uniref:DUF6531 domain-containing protein n=1 Tax=Planctomonas sp. JC2975 TaxID=2729626 RepID=UPI001473C45B|nr:DUF6531 domain-containing protein [Planctomonas sp. JC2975]NNC11910.1 type IV secretion protein Rhs [Planctomonas sp. JC2975]
MAPGGNKENVKFSDSDAQALVSACNNAADAIDGQKGSRSSARSTGLDQFKGYFSTLFHTNGTTQVSDATEVSSALRQVAKYTVELQKSADAEQQRRVKARQWEDQQKHRNMFEKGWDDVSHLWGGDAPPVPDAEPQVHHSAPKPPAGSRETPQPGSGGGVPSGTSSAIPANLRSFATSTTSDDTTLTTHHTAVQKAYAAFTASCGWGSLEAGGVVLGFQQFIDANKQEVTWANTIAGAFDKAGGSGSLRTLSNQALAAALAAAHVNASRTDLTIDMPSALGGVPTSGYADDPVNTATGNFTEPETDLAFDGGCSTLGFTRTYNSASETVGAFGPGWASWTEIGLLITPDAARWVQPDGRHIVFPRTDDGWGRATGASYWLELFGDGFVASDNTGGRWKFTTAGRLEYFERGAGTRIDAMYGVDGRLEGLVHERGRSVSLEWQDSRVVSLAASDGRVVAFHYDAQGRLTGATGPTGRRNYVWGEASGLVEQVIDADGVVEVLNEYDAKGRVASQRSPFGRLSRYSYLPGGVTEVADTDGERANTWIADALGRLTNVIDSHGNSQSYVWDTHGDLLEVTDRVGQRTVREYDERGRLVHEVLPTGADVQYGHDELDRVITVVVGAADDGGSDAVTTYEYDGENRNPSVILDPVGGRTTMAWDDNLLTQVTDPTGVVLRFDYDARGDLVATTNALGASARLERDSAGRVIAAVTPSGHRTAYTYDDAGLLIGRRDPDGAVWRFEHSVAGRLTAEVAPDGGRTEIEYGPTGEETRTIDPLGRSIARVLDDIGNVASVELPDGSTWSYTHDSLSRLVETVDPTGGVWVNSYDANGELVAATDPTGASRASTIDRAGNSETVDDGLLAATLRRDALGRPVSATSGDEDTRTYVYDACGRVVEILDGEGSLTQIRRDLAGRPVEVTDPTGVTTRYAYDACGRLVEVIGPDGTIATREYDADSLLVRQVLANGDAAWAKYDLCGRLLRLHQPGSGTSTYTYDRCGRVASAADRWWGTRRFTYDVAGQLVAVTNGLGGVTRYEYDQNSRLVRIIDPAGAVTSREWDGMNRLVSETDPLGRVTSAGYDLAGRQVWQQTPDGHRFGFGFDASGRETSTTLDGTMICTVTRDLRARVQTVDDFSGSSPVTHTREWDRVGRILRDSRTVDGGEAAEITWSYDRAGRRTAMVDAFGRTTSYAYDSAGRLTSVEHPALGTVALTYDGAGEVVTAIAVDAEGNTTRQTWERVDGDVTAHTITGAAGRQNTLIERDSEGRVEAITRDGITTRYGYDLAEELTSAITEGLEQVWAFDTNGRIVSSVDGGRSETYGYDPAGQLIAVHHDDGTTTDHTYDPSGRRTRTLNADGSAREYEWTVAGRLSRLTDTTSTGERRSTTAHTDATGRLSAVGSDPVWWDAAAAVPTLVGVGDTAVLPLGTVTGIGSSWSTPGWRAGRNDTVDPWRTGATVGLSGGLGITPTGTLTIGAGADLLEWLGARPYDPATRGFLATDPVPPVVGAGWAGNPYNYAGNNPLAFSDPTGLHPLTDDELRKQTQGWLADAWDSTTKWAGDTWNSVSKWATTGWGAWVIGGVMVVAGGALMITGVGGPAGAMLLSAGADTLIQKATTGTVNYGEVVLSGALGGIGDFGVAAKLGMTGIKAAAVSGAVAGGTGGVVLGEYNYFTGPGPHTVTGALGHGATGLVAGAATGAAGSAFTEAAGSKISSAVASKLHPDGVHMPEHAAGVGRHAAPPNYGGKAAAFAATHGTAGVIATANDYADGDRDPGALARTGFVGTVMGAYSPGSHPAHAAH